jgi:hypothetical protein
MKIKLFMLKKAKERIEKKNKNTEESKKNTEEQGKNKEESKNDLQTRVRSIKEQYKTMPKEIRWMSNKDGIMVQANKTELLKSLQKHDRRLECAVRIQSRLRGHFVRLLWHLSNTAKAANCINDTDFFTLETFAEFPTELLYCYADASCNKFHGFNICSLITLLMKQNHNNNGNNGNNNNGNNGNALLNPYTRGALNADSIIHAYRLARIVHKETKTMPIYSTNPTLWDLITPSDRNTSHNIFFEREVRNPPNYAHRLYPHIQWVLRPSLIDMAINGDFTPVQQNTLYNLAFLETMSTYRRLVELFMDFNLFGNYTNVHWFLQLNRFQLRRFYTNLRTAWHSLTPELRQAICIIGNPYDIVHVASLERTPEEDVRMACTMIMEMMTYGGETFEDKKLGVFQILVALCSVSHDARRSLQHLL